MKPKGSFMDKFRLTFCAASFAFEVHVILPGKKSQTIGPESCRHLSLRYSFSCNTRKSDDRWATNCTL